MAKKLKPTQHFKKTYFTFIQIIIKNYNYQLRQNQNTYQFN